MSKNRKVNISDMNYLSLEDKILELTPSSENHPKTKDSLFKNPDYKKGYMDAITEVLHVLKEELG